MGYLDYYARDCLKYVPSHKLHEKKVLIVGCNDGRDCQLFLQSAAVHGVDICAEIGTGFVNEKVTYFKESAEAMSRPDNYYDIVFSAATMEHILNIESAFAEMFRVTKPGGLIYCVGASLWNSYYGHHQYGLFSDYPWIHLRLAKNQILEYLNQHKTLQDIVPFVELLEKLNLLSVPLVKDDQNSYAENLVNFMFSDYFNFRPSTQYLKAVEPLDVSYIIRNDIWQDGENLLTDEILEELNAKGYTKDELLAAAHTYIAIK